MESTSYDLATGTQYLTAWQDAWASRTTPALEFHSQITVPFRPGARLPHKALLLAAN